MPPHEKTCLSARSDTNHAVQPQGLARDLKLPIKKLDILSRQQTTKALISLHGSAADLCLCFTCAKGRYNVAHIMLSIGYMDAHKNH